MHRLIVLFFATIKFYNYKIIVDSTIKKPFDIILNLLLVQKMDILKSVFRVSHLTFAHFYFLMLFSTLLLLKISSSVYSQSSTEPCRADCAAGEAQIVAPATAANQPLS